MSVSKSGAVYHGVEVRLASTLDELVKCMNLRAAAFIGREGEPYHEEFDGNDLFTAAHLLALDNDVPVGTMRVRILEASEGGVATWQRFASTPKGRLATRVLLALAEAARDYTIYKGVETVVGEVADPRLIRFWERFGFKLVDAPPVYYNGVPFYPMMGRMDARGGRLQPDPGAFEAQAFYAWRSSAKRSSQKSNAKEAA